MALDNPVDDSPDDQKVKDLLDLLDNYTPDNSVVNPDNDNDTVISPDDFLPSTSDESTVIVSGDVISTDITNENTDNTEIVGSEVKDSSTTINNESTEVKVDNTEVVDGISDLTNATDQIADAIAQGNEDQHAILESIDDTLKDQFSAQERDRRKNAIINETTPFDNFVDAQNNGQSDPAASNGGLLGGVIPPFGGGNRTPKDDKKWKDKTKAEKFKTGAKLTGKVAMAAAALGLVYLTAKDKIFPDGVPEWMPFVGEDEEGNSDSPISDAVASVGLAGAGYYGAKKIGQKYFGDVTEADAKIDAKVPDVNEPEPETKPKDLPEPETKPKVGALVDETKVVPDPKGEKWYNKLGEKAKGAAKYADDALSSTGKFLGRAAGPAFSILASGFDAYSQMSDIDANTSLTEEQKTTEKTKVVGTAVVDGAASAGGFAAGAATGAAIGSVVPVIGTAIGGIVGGLLGGYGGSMLAEATGLTEAGGEFAVAARDTYNEIAGTASSMYDNAESVLSDTVDSGKQLVSDATTAIGSYISGLFGATDSSSQAIKDNTKQSAAVVRESTEYLNMETMEMLNPDSKNPSSVGQTVTALAKFPNLFAPVLGIAGTGLKELFGDFGTTIVDSITDLTESVSEFGDMLWDNLVNVFEGDSDTERALTDAKKKFEKNTDEEGGFFSNLFGSQQKSNNIVVVGAGAGSSGGNVPTPKIKPNYVQTDSAVSDATAKINVVDAGMNVKAVDYVQVPQAETSTSQTNNYYGNQTKPAKERKKPEMKMVSRREMSKSNPSGVSFAAPTLNNTPSTVSDPVLGLVNMGAL